MEFKPGDVVRHKATQKRCVVRELLSDGYINVTTQDDEVRNYMSHELEKEQEASIDIA